jgi:hypothetical protein
MNTMVIPQAFYVLNEEAQRLNHTANKLICDTESDMSRRRTRKGYLDKADMADWYRNLADADALYEQARQKEAEAASAQAEFWKAQYLDDMDRTEQMKEESELRGQI